MKLPICLERNEEPVISGMYDSQSHYKENPSDDSADDADNIVSENDVGEFKFNG